MTEFWKEMASRGDCSEDKPLSRPGGALKGHSGYSGAPIRGTTPKDKDYLDTGFTLNEVGPCVMRVWAAFQAVGLTFHFLLWREVSAHLAAFDAVVARECAPEHLQHGVCAGPMWNVSARQDLVLSGQSWFNPAMDIVIPDESWSNSRSFRFTTASLPPTFLVVVDPVARAEGGPPPEAPRELARQASELEDASWRLDVRRLGTSKAGPVMTRRHAGRQALTFEDLSAEARRVLAEGGRAEWLATLTSQSPSSSSTRYVVVVEDALTPHLEEIRASPQCAFGRSWKAFNEHRQGRSHGALTWCRFLLGLFLLFGCAAVCAVYSWKGRLRFQVVVMAKFLLQDVPMQVCIVLYLSGWYESSGLRCQLCLFEPRHCSGDRAFSAANLVALACALLSSIAHQLLIRPVYRKVYSQEDICMQYFVRIGGVCVSILPFTTAMCYASGSLIPMPRLLHVLFAMPCGIGWFILPFSMCCAALHACPN